jgi:hypothetical protein
MFVLFGIKGVGLVSRRRIEAEDRNRPKQVDCQQV